MNTRHRNIAGVLILADESADWIVAGLHQLQRLILALGEYSQSATALPVCTFPNSGRALPSIHLRETNLQLTDDIEHFFAEMQKSDGDILVLNTRLVVDRGGIQEIVDLASADEEVPALILSSAEIKPSSESFASLTNQIAARSPASIDERYTYLDKIDKVEIAGSKLFSNTAKSQDGIVSRFVNRPISRAVSRFLVRLPLLPNQWTLIAMAIPIAGTLLLLRGDYFGFAVGAILFQLHSVLDGCDGEIARAKYLESPSGQRLDGLCDRFTTLLYAVALGFGLSRQNGLADAMRWFYPLEGVMAALFIGVGETLLTRDKIDNELERETQDNLYPDYVKAHRGSFNEGDQLKLWMIKNSGMLKLGQRATLFFGQATKRDVFNFGFMLLALCGLPSLILHILAIVACVILVLAVRNLSSAAVKTNQSGAS